MKVNFNGKIEDLRALWFEDGLVKFLDQRKIPEKIEIFVAKDYMDIAFAIKEMVVRGAPAIGVSAAYGIAQAYLQKRDIYEV